MTAINPDIGEQLASFSWNGSLTPDEAMELCRHARAVPGLAQSHADDGFHIAARYEDVLAVMGDPVTFSSEPSVFRPIAEGWVPVAPLESDPPDHKQWRDIFRELVNPRRAKTLQSQIRMDIDAHIDHLIGKGEADLIADLADYVPAQTICRAAGIDDLGQAERITQAALALHNAVGVEPENFPRYVMEFGQLVLPLIYERRQSPRQDFLTRLADAETGGQPLADEMLVNLMFGLFGAGNHSTIAAMATFFYDVLSRPAVRAQLSAQPELIPQAAEESLRLHPPFFGFFRRATKPAEISGCPIAENESVLLNWMSANRDPAQFADPDEFRLDRARNSHLTFGYGIHKCIGASLARLELQIAMEQVLSRIPDIELTGPPPTRYFGGGSSAYLDTLPVRFSPRSANRAAIPA